MAAKKKWIYVQVEETQNAPCSFSHTTVLAHTEQDALAEGKRHFEQMPTKERATGWAFLNDYVIKA